MSIPGTQSDAKTPLPYIRIGGEVVIRAMVKRFYELMDTLPEAKACREIHGPSLVESERSLFEYLSFWLGGPDDFVKRRGQPMLRARHLHAPIGIAERDGWVLCFVTSWHEHVKDKELTEMILPQVVRLADHMRNKEG